MKGKSGITLTALIITIIVMLTLVGVVLDITLDGQLFGQAQKAAKTYSEKQDIEIIRMAIDDYRLRELNAGETRTLVEFLNDHDWCESATNNGNYTTTVIMKKGGGQYLIDEQEHITAVTPND